MGMRSTQPDSTRRWLNVTTSHQKNVEDEHVHEWHPDRPDQQEEVRDALDLVVLLWVIVTTTHDLQVRVEEGAHLACGAIELVFAAVPSVEDALGDRRAKHKGNEEIEGRRGRERVAQPAAARVETAAVAAVEEDDGAQRDGKEQHNGRYRAHE
eukprot:scaffold14406_cov69-Phaeocystis_antarctica.AAC.3